ncbi:CDP-alcohol phosphatidyltransferase family protein [bacterium]|nr:CDP-alcohol phosphatidyltransferase family protein [bacterium]
MANFISIFRIFVMFCAIFLIVSCPGSVSAYVAALIFTIFAFALDGVDGYVARKFHEESKLGALLDIMGDRIVENSYWILFAVMGWLSILFPLIAITRGFITDTIRSAAMEKGYTAFGENTMQKSKVAKFICGSRFMRISYAVAKVAAFVLIIAARIPTLPNAKMVGEIGFWCAVFAIVFCVVRGIPVVIEAKYLFEDKADEGDKE